MATILAGVCAVPPADVGSPSWNESRDSIFDAFQKQRDRAAAIDAGTREPIGETARRIHGLPDGVPYPPAWRLDPAERADDYLRRLYDVGDLRALGYCRDCGGAITLRQVGRCVYSEPCGHYRAQGDLKRILAFRAERLKKISEERKAALMALIGR